MVDPSVTAAATPYLAGLAVQLTMRVIDGLAPKLRKAFKGTKKDQALARCALAAEAAFLPEDDPQHEAYFPVLQAFFARDDVVAEWTKLVEGRAPDERVLARAFDQTMRGRALPSFDFPERLARAVEAFLQCAAAERELKDIIQLAQLRDQTQALRGMATDPEAIERALELVGHGNVTAQGDIHARDIITGVQLNIAFIYPTPFSSPPDLRALRADYLAYLRESYEHLDIKGIMQLRSVQPSMPLAAVYVPLKARPQRPDAGESWARVAGRLLPEFQLAEPVLTGRGAAPDSSPVAIEGALRHEPAVVVLGDPGAGKSTLLKVIALALARQPDGPLPILVPLNAYARRLRTRGEVALADFLGEYYASRQKKLADVGAVFADALCQGQAVLLLDGLDEVKTGRAFLVRLVQDFIAECVPQPSIDDKASPGNRAVVTSRVVGYDEAPLTGPQWRLYTLTDFDRADIERFVGAWTLAFEIGVHKGDTPVAREAAERERRELLDSIFARPSVERLATNPLLLTILALIKRVGVTLPERRAELYNLYLKALIESWDLARALDHHAVQSDLEYLDTVQVLAPLALWLRETNPSAGIVSEKELEDWLTDYHEREWSLSRGEARKRGRAFLNSVHRHSNLLVERGERQYGFLHLTLEEMLAAKGIAQLLDDVGLDQAVSVMQRHLPEPAWRETLLLAIGVIGVVQEQPKIAGRLLTALLNAGCAAAPCGANVVLAGEALLDVGRIGVDRAAAGKVTAALSETMQSGACHIRERRDAGVLLGRLGWRPEPEEGDLVWAPAETVSPPTGLDAFRPVGDLWVGTYPVTNLQYERFVRAGGYEERQWWTNDGWAWRQGTYDSKAPDYLKDWLKNRPPDRRSAPFWWSDRDWNSPLQPVVGVSWFEALAFCAWCTHRLRESAASARVCRGGQLVPPERTISLGAVRLPHEAEWERAVGGRGDYPWGIEFDPTRLNCADVWAGRDLSRSEDWRAWLNSDERKPAGTTPVCAFPGGRSGVGVWDGAGNVWEWMADRYSKQGEEIAVRGGSWFTGRMNARVSARFNYHPDYFLTVIGFRVVVAPI